MMASLLVSVRWHEGRYHGSGQWPPAPARFFQALVAAAARGRNLPAEAQAALMWLESLPSPRIGAPRARPGQKFITYVPNNDLDSVGGDPARVAEIRTDKGIRPFLFDEEIPLVYSWKFPETDQNRRQAAAICDLCRQLFQLGRGVDQAWSWGELLSEAELEERLVAYPGAVHQPTRTGRGLSLLNPAPGSLSSLINRFESNLKRFETMGTGAERQLVLRQAPPAHFVPVVYDGAAVPLIFQLFRDGLASWPLRRAAILVDWVRKEASARLARAFPGQSATVERVFCGTKSDSEVDKTERIRILALPSVGHEHADMYIRRLLVQVPSECPLSAQDVAWAFSGLEVIDPTTGEYHDLRFVPAEEGDRMAQNYGVGNSHCLWQSVTPLVLPDNAARRRIEPSRQRTEAKPGSERLAEERRAGSAVLQALRHAGCEVPVDQIWVQREPFLRKGERAERFAEGTRFRKERLWHVKIHFRRPLFGPLTLGDGRFLGLGLMAPSAPSRPILAYQIASGLFDRSSPEQLSVALRRAVMARVQAWKGSLPAYFSGHRRDGEPLRDDHDHLAFSADLTGRRLFIFGPENHSLENSRHFEELTRAMAEFEELLAGSCGRLKLRSLPLVDDDPIWGAGKTWESLSDYQPTRHPKKQDSLPDFLRADLKRELARRGFSGDPEIEILSATVGPRRGGIRARFRVRFPSSVSGPIFLGQSSHKGGGLFGRCQ